MYNYTKVSNKYSIHIQLEITCLLEFPNYDKYNQDILKFNETEIYQKSWHFVNTQQNNLSKDP